LNDFISLGKEITTRVRKKNPILAKR
jgi:hypothetical protein